MSGFVCILDRTGNPVQHREIRRLAEPLVAAGQATSVCCQGPAGIAVIHHPGLEGGRHGPLVGGGSGLVVAVAGRFSMAERSTIQGPETKDPASQGWATWAASHGAAQDPGRLGAVSGAFVLLVANPNEGWMSITRDHLGALKACYHLDPRRLIAASDPAAILRHPQVCDELDEGSIARYFAFRFAAEGGSLFRSIREVPPAHRLEVSKSDSSCRQYWRLRRLRSFARQEREEARAEFLARLEHSVSSDVADLAPERLAVSLSGGLDSTAVAAFLPEGARAYSWTFGGAPGADERGNIEAAAEHLGLPLRWVQGDGLFPLCEGFAERFVTIGSPRINAFAALKARLYEQARTDGCQRVVVGDAGDALYAAWEYWLLDLIRSGSPKAAAYLGRTIWRALRAEDNARRTLRRLIPVPRLRGKRRVPWLTPEGHSLLPADSPSPILPPGGARHRADLVAGAKHIELVSEEQRSFPGYGIGRSNPFWSWPLVELALRLPAHWIYDGQRYKVLAREALRGLLPEQLLASGPTGLLGFLYLRGIEAARTRLSEQVFRRPRSDWQRFVDRGWVEPYLHATGEVRFGHTILWFVICYELWVRRLLER